MKPDSKIVEQFNGLSIKAQAATLEHLAAIHDYEKNKGQSAKFIALVRREIAKEEKRLAKLS